MIIKINRRLNAHECVKCAAALDDSDFFQVGIVAAPPAVFVDYNCPMCQHQGRYLINPSGSNASVHELIAEMCDRVAAGCVSVRLSRADWDAT